MSNKGNVNARGDEIDSQGQVVIPASQKAAKSYAQQVGSQTAVARPEQPNISPSANPNAPLSPKQLRELEALKKAEPVVPNPDVDTPLLDKLIESSAPVKSLSPSEISQAELEPIDEPEKVVMKSADDAPDSFGAEGELHREETELAELEEDFDIEAIKKAALENIVVEPAPKTKQVKSTKKGKK